MELLNLNLIGYLSENKTIKMYVRRQLTTDRRTWEAGMLDHDELPPVPKDLQMLASKLQQMNYHYSPKYSHQSFISKCSNVTFKLAIMITKYAIPDPLYTELRSRFILMLCAVHYLLGVEDPDATLDLFCTKDQYESIIYALKLLNVMRMIKKDKFNHSNTGLTAPQVGQIKQSFFYQAFIQDKSVAVKDSVYECPDEPLDVLLGKEKLVKGKLLSDIWETLHAVYFECSEKVEIYKELEMEL